MKRATKRILTTHTGSLPRPDSLLAQLNAKEAGEPGDRAAFEACVRSAVADVVRKQAETGIDVINDGEMSKPGYATYIKDRLSGFGGESVALGVSTRPADLQDFPEYATRLFSSGPLTSLKMPACDGAIAYRDMRDLELDIDSLKAAMSGVKSEEAFMSAASPGVISLFLPDHHYGNHEAYLAALADAMKAEYEAIHRAGFLLQVDCPDLAMGRHIQFADLSVPEFRKKAALHVEALNHALAAIPAEAVRLHLCWGNYEGPHHRDVELKDIVNIVTKAKAAAISFEAANPRHEHEWKVWQDAKLPAEKVLIPGVIDSSTNFIEHPALVAERITRFAQVVGRENVIAGTDCGFSTFAGFTVAEPGIAWAKLAALVEGARIATRELWRKPQRSVSAKNRTAGATRERPKSRTRRK
jgi:5-methyltetrahydropteroyltriglutamate--homocysteine methyltransferase